MVLGFRVQSVQICMRSALLTSRDKTKHGGRAVRLLVYTLAQHKYLLAR